MNFHNGYLALKCLFFLILWCYSNGCGLWLCFIKIEVELGIDIKSKVVSLNHKHDLLVVTDPSKNPMEHDIGIDRFLTAVYQRKKAKSRSGDGNPLMYALKGMNNFSILDADKDELYNNMKDIVSRHYKHGSFDSVVVLPSSKPIAGWVGKACSEALGAPIEKNAFIKATNAKVLLQLQDIKDDSEIIQLRKTLEKKPGGVFSMKYLTQHQRAFVRPVHMNPFFKKELNRILLVDDLVSSGATFKAGLNAFKDKFPNTDVDCLSLLGPVT